MDIVSAFQKLSIDTKTYASGKHYVTCPKTECESRKKKNQKTLLLDFTTGHYKCFHCDWSGFALSNNPQSQAPAAYEPPPKAPQK